MKKQILLFIPLYLLILIVIVYGFVYEEIEIIIPSLLILVILLILGFMFNSYTLKQKYEIDENVLHLTKEILHELAIPISTIQANVLLLSRTYKEDEKSMKRLGRIDDSSKRLERLYEELLYSIKKEIQTVECEKTDLVVLIEERVKVMKLLNRNKFVLSLEAHNVLVDKIGFEKMLDNILNNAMKYSPKESQIEVELKDAKLSIKDHGVGMDANQILHIYERYYQGDNSLEGEGIGLALVKRYCDEADLEIKIHSEPGQGTRVVLDFRGAKS